MFIGTINLTPGQELRQFDVYRDGEHKTTSGRVISNSWEWLGELKAVLAAAKPEEIERWRQLEHPITHKIIQQGTTPFEIRAEIPSYRKENSILFRLHHIIQAD